MITQLRNKEAGFSLLELSVAVGVAAIVASAGIVATTAFIGDAQDKRDNYTANADRAIADAESSSLALGLTPVVAAGNTTPSTVSSSSATITWDAPVNPVDSFTILVDGEVVAENGSATATGFTLTGLNPGTTYSIVVRSVGPNGTADAATSLTTDALFAQAAATGPQSSTLEFSAFDTGTNQYNSGDALGVFNGGQVRDFTTGEYGFTAAAFDSLGMMGLEWTTSLQAHLRRAISPDPFTSDINPGGLSTWVTAGYISADPTSQLYVDKNISLEGNQIKFEMRHRSLADEPASKRRSFLTAELATGYNPVYVGAGTSTLLIQDANGVHPTLIMNVDSPVAATFEGGANIYTDLVDGEMKPTLYITPGNNTDFTTTLTVGVIDADTCSAEAAAVFAANEAGTFGEEWASINSCVVGGTFNE